MNKSDFMVKGILFTVLGIILIFLPKVITYTLYGVCIILGISCLGLIFQSLSKGEPGAFVAPVIGLGAVIAAIVFLPKIIAFGMGVIGGIAIAVLGLTRIVKANKSPNKSIGIVVGIIMLVVGGICIINPFQAASLARILIGIVVLINGLFNLFAAHVAGERNSSSSSGIIDVKGFTIDDK